MKKRIFSITITTLVTLSVFSTAVLGQRRVENDVDLQPGGVDSNLGIEEIRIPFFGQPEFLKDSAYYSIFSWISFLGMIFSIGLILYWVFLIVRASFKAVKSEGNEEGLQDSFERVKSVFVGAAVAIAIPLIISVFGALLGLGPLWSWPAGLRNCPGTDRDYYFQEALDQRQSGAADPISAAEAACFSSAEI